jgi:hypothetical protein
MQRNFDIQNIEEGETKNKKIMRRVIRIKAKNNKKVEYNDIHKFFKALKDSGHNANKVAIRAMAPDKVYTVKSFEADELAEFDADEYYKERADDTKKFSEYSFVDFIIYK